MQVSHALMPPYMLVAPAVQGRLLIMLSTAGVLSMLCICHHAVHSWRGDPCAVVHDQKPLTAVHCSGQVMRVVDEKKMSTLRLPLC